MKKILRVVGGTQYVERVDFYMGDIEKIILTRDPREAYDWALKLEPEYYGVLLIQLAEWGNKEGFLLEVVEVL